MYLVNTELTVNWILRNTMIDIPRTDLDVRIRPPQDSGGNVVYTNDAIAAEDFLAATVDTNGWASYSFTPTIEGLWELVLTDGDETNNTFYYETLLEIQSPDNHIRKEVKGELL